MSAIGFGTQSARRIDRCSCPRTDAMMIEWPDPDCREHGRGDERRAGDPLACLALVIDQKTGEALTQQAARDRLREDHPEAFRGDVLYEWGWWASRFRGETPRETEARLFAERAPAATQEDET